MINAKFSHSTNYEASSFQKKLNLKKTIQIQQKEPNKNQMDVCKCNQCQLFSKLSMRSKLQKLAQTNNQDYSIIQQPSLENSQIVGSLLVFLNNIDSSEKKKQNKLFLLKQLVKTSLSSKQTNKQQNNIC
ncbi:hypothetical protein TTHERM_00607130 (macronuclear) [Tetrahymena thermophila SB210]|uniref:Uncharacterized protein n=1 Tax=Tetrahymena thermophila (strain SB210) TaxID=312017 RepID=Q22YH8_TETTS|nr:hypothetical protein TTHERM_00607130 [Tetrahymena thermophila SB210]EAR90307.1 hypothetical protein TTHERM_00607130 [Tetrahymena thermophila SB210]|eukprot:XP_001010552.1 hypothetical protein TTHERM_00607130 [Tetrahymena thermophila SB210]